MSKTQNTKSKFRATAKWKRFRSEMKKTHGVDLITQKPLLKAWNLHHLMLTDDMSVYSDITDETHFACLNKQTHEMVHWLYRYYVKDKSIIGRLEDLLEDMYYLNNTGKKMKKEEDEKTNE